MKFSILIPTTGRPNLTKLAIESVLAQRDLGNTEIEIVVVDTVAGNAVLEMIRAFADRRIFYHKVPNGDPSLGWDFACRQANGDYLMLLDDDNYLLDYAISVFAKTIEKTGADIVTGYHIYYYDKNHPSPFQRNMLKIEHPDFFDGEVVNLPPRLVADSLLSLAKGFDKRFKLHPASTVFSRAIRDRLIRQIGYVIVPHMVCNHSGTFTIFMKANATVGVGLPLSVVGRLGVSYTQTYHSRKRNRLRQANFIKSPLHGDLYVNHVVESMLVARDALLPDTKDIVLSKAPLFEKYARQLAATDNSFSKIRAWWVELFSEVGLLPEGQRVKLLPRFKGLKIVSYILWPLKFFRLWPLVGSYIFIKPSLKNTIRFTVSRNLNRLRRRKKGSELKLSDSRDITLKDYDIFSIDALARRFSEILALETGLDLSVLVNKLKTVLKH